MTDMNLAWLRLSACEEGTPERVLSELLRRRGVSTVLARLDIERHVLAAWVADKAVPDTFHSLVCEVYRSTVAADQRAGVGKIDVAKAVEMRASDEKLDVIAATFDVSKQAVSKALKKAAGRNEAAAAKKEAADG